MGPSMIPTTQAAQQSTITQVQNSNQPINTDTNTAATAVSIPLPQTSQIPPLSESDSEPDNLTYKVNNEDLLLTIGSATLQAKQTVLSASDTASRCINALVVGSSTLTADGSAVVLQDQTISLVSLAQSLSPSQSINLNQNTAAGLGIVVGGTTLRPAAAAAAAATWTTAASGPLVPSAQTARTSTWLSGSSVAMNQGSTRSSSAAQKTSGSGPSTAKANGTGSSASRSGTGAAVTASRTPSSGNESMVGRLHWFITLVAVLGVLL